MKRWGILAAALAVAWTVDWAAAQKPAKKPAKVELKFPPTLPDGKTVVTDTSEEFLKPTTQLKDGVAIAKTPPTIDFLYYPGQTYPGKLWSNWGDSVAVGGKYYAPVGDHDAPAGNAYVYEYDPDKKTCRIICETKKVLNMPEGHYAPGKIHGRVDMGSDGWIYFSTHRGSTTVTTDKYHYLGDWIIRCDPATGKAEAVVQGPVPKHCIPCSVLDPDRLIFYGGTAAGTGGEADAIQFFAYDCKNRKLLYAGPDGPSRYMIFVKSTGRIYYTPGKEGKVEGSIMRYDPAKGGAPEKIPGEIGLRAATQETPQGMVYTCSQAGKGDESQLYSFNTRTEKVEKLGPLAVGVNQYVASLDVDPTGRYVYYVPGAHGGADKDGSPVVQFDTKTRQKKVIAFLHPFYQAKYGGAMKGTYSTAVDPKGDKLYITWNISRGSKDWDCCGLTVIHTPESERQP